MPYVLGGFSGFSRFILVSVLTFFFFFCQEDEFLDGQLTLVVEDALEGGPEPTFSPRSVIHVRSVKSGNAVITHTRQWTVDLEQRLRVSLMSQVCSEFLFVR